MSRFGRKIVKTSNLMKIPSGYVTDGPISGRKVKVTLDD